MKYSEFEQIMSQKRMDRYLNACKGRKRKAIVLYNENLRLAGQVYALINYFEIALRNSIDRTMTQVKGNNWLRDAVLPGGILDSPKCHDSQKIIMKKYKTLINDNEYSHSKLLSSLEFGIWRYMFSPVQYKATGQVLLNIFPMKPKSSKLTQYNNVYFFNELYYINNLRNRIAHQEPICFSHSTRLADTRYIRIQRNRIIQLLEYMGINVNQLLKGVDNVLAICDGIDMNFCN